MNLHGSFREPLQRLFDHLEELEKQIGKLNTKIQQWHKASEVSRKPGEIPGGGPITATALAAPIGDATSVKNRR